MRLAELLQVSFASINRWENGQSKPSPLAWRQIVRAERAGLESLIGKPDEEAKPLLKMAETGPLLLDFRGDPETLRTVAEGERLTYAFLFNPAFATETSIIDPLPHQRIAVYDRMLSQARLRFLLADDAGAGKTIMAGLYIREMLSRRLIRRILVVPPAGLVGNWERELRTLFSLSFKKVRGADARDENPFAGGESDQIIVSVDTLAGERVFSRLRDPAVEPYDLVIFDEAHKLSARRDPDGTMRRTDRYCLAEALAGAQPSNNRWQLPWSANHLLLLSATPHMGHDFPYFCLWRLLEPDVLTTPDAFDAYPVEARERHFIRRTKEEMLTYEGARIYPTRQCDTLSYELTPGEVGEQTLYDGTSEYLRDYYNKASFLNRSAARLALSIFQRRLASSTWALLRSFERRIEKLDRIIEDIRAGRITEEELRSRQGHLNQEAYDVYEAKTGDEEESEAGQEENESVEAVAMGGVVAMTLSDLLAERGQVQSLLDLARKVYDKGDEAKFEKLKEFLRDSRYHDEKVLIFTEHRDTADFLVKQLGKIGFGGQVATIHGGLDYVDRDAQVEFFRKPVDQGGARYLVATDAAGEGINLQFCWLMVNYDVPWNPARLEQRMGRIHRYGQKREQVVIANFVAGKTREGKVLKTLLDKLEKIRHRLGTDKVFDVVGRLFEGVSFSQYMERATEKGGVERAVAEVEGRLTEEQVKALEERERKLYGEGGDVGRQLPEERRKREEQEMRRLLPGYVQRFVERAAPLVGLRVEGDPRGTFSLKPVQPGVADAFWEIVENYPEEIRWRFSAHRPARKDEAIFLRPGEPFFDRFRAEVEGRYRCDALRGAVFVDPHAERPYLLHVLSIGVSRSAVPDMAAFRKAEVLDRRLVAIRQEGEDRIESCPVEHLLLLKGLRDVPPEAIRLIGEAQALRERAKLFATDRIVRPLAEEFRVRINEALPGREAEVRTGFDFEEGELAELRQKAKDRLEKGDAKAEPELQRIRERQFLLAKRREAALSALKLEPELIAALDPEFVAHALVVPSRDPEDLARHDIEVEAIAVKIAWEYERSRGGTVRDVSTRDKARAAGLPDYPGFDLHSKRMEGERAIEVKGLSGSGNIEMTENEIEKAMTHREKYWLYVVFDCGTAHPRLVRVQDPAKQLIYWAKGSVIVEHRSILEKSEADG